MEDLCFKARISVPTFFTKAISKFPIKESFIRALIRIPQLWKTGELDELFLEGHGVKVGPGPWHLGPRVPPQSLKVGPQASLQNLKVGLQDPLTFLSRIHFFQNISSFFYFFIFVSFLNKIQKNINCE